MLYSLVSSSFAFSIADAHHWDLHDLIAVVSQEHKATGSTGGHAIAHTSPLQNARIAHASERIEICRRALLDRDFEKFADIVQLDSNMMHAVMMSSSPPLLYWQPSTLAVVQQVRAWRKQGIAACTTIDAGPNVHVLCLAEASDEVSMRLDEIPGIARVLKATPGGPAKLVD